MRGCLPSLLAGSANEDASARNKRLKADLNQQFPRQILIADPALAQTKVSGVLVLDNQDAVIRRLALLAPIKALPSADGIVLRSDPAAKP